jgi:hypothetical protein
MPPWAFAERYEGPFGKVSCLSICSQTVWRKLSENGIRVTYAGTTRMAGASALLDPGAHAAPLQGKKTQTLCWAHCGLHLRKTAARGGRVRQREFARPWEGWFEAV